MASLLDTLVAAGLQPLDAHEITLLHREGQAIFIEEKALIQSARRGWWAMEKVPNAYKRLLDAQPDAALIKGGPGSGYHAEDGHAGRPGLRGGSTSDGINDSDDDDTLFAQAELPKKMTFATHPGVTLTGDLNNLKEFNLTPADVADIVDLGLDGGRVSVYADYVTISRDKHLLRIHGDWFDSTGLRIGEFDRRFTSDSKTAEFESMSFVSDYLGKGLGTKAAHQWYQKLADKGYETVKLNADATIGRYAWAKEGAQYDDGGDGYMAEQMTKKFRRWLETREIPGLAYDDTPTFSNPQDVANYKHPSGYKVRGDRITNERVPANLEMDLGKAFMLDQDASGHGDWNAIINLKDWKGRGKAYKAVSVSDLIGDNEMHYVDMGKPIEGASDALFWAQYLEEDEGEPVFNFGETSSDKRGRIIKGGPKSGFHGHAGRPGERGGSKPSGSASRTNLGSIRADAGAGEQVATNDPLFTVIHGNDGWAQAPHHREIPVNYYLPKDNHEKVLKDSVAEQLAADLGIDYGMANEFIHDWAMSSNDSRMESLIHQKLAAAHFGTELTEWQKAQLQNARNKRNKFLNEYIDEMFGWDDSPVLASVTLDHLERQMSQQFGGSEGSLFYPFESDIMRQMAKDQDLGWLKDKAETKAFLRKIERKSESLTKQAIQSIYQRTQEKLAAAGITDLRLYRGTIQKHSQLGSPGDWPEVKLNALSSWSASEYTADQGFAYQNEWNFKEDHTIGTVLAAVVPAKRIYAMPSTGPGALFEWEMIVIGDKSPEPVLVKTIYKDQRKTR